MAPTLEESGPALFGGMTFGIVTAVILSRRWGFDLWALLDAAAVGIPAGQVIGRWGNYFNQELFGTPSGLPWAVEIDPVNRPAELLHGHRPMVAQRCYRWKGPDEPLASTRRRSSHRITGMWARHLASLEAGMLPTIPAGVLAQVWRGNGRQANLIRFLRPCEIDPLDGHQARAVGAALGVTCTSDVVDASVLLGAALRGEAVVTGDGKDLRSLADRLGLAVPIIDV